MSEEALRKLALAVRNWGKWGPDDELGTLNYITPDTIAEGCRLATTGKVFALGVRCSARGRRAARVHASTPSTRCSATAAIVPRPRKR
jgi:hypothetical protein